jgi:tetratricopeptide (TPR) repeat protein
MKDLWRLALRAERRRDYATALVAYRRLVHDRGFQQSARLSLAQVLAHLGRHDESKALLDDFDASLPALAGEAGERSRYLRLTIEGEIHQSRGDFAAAAETFRKAAEVRHHTAPLIFLGGALWRQGKLDEAEATYRRATTVEGDVDEALENLGYLLRAQERNEEALATLRQAHELDPRSRRIAAAIEDLEDAIAMEQPDGEGDATATA